MITSNWRSSVSMISIPAGPIEAGPRRYAGGKDLLISIPAGPIEAWGLAVQYFLYRYFNSCWSD